MGEPNAGTTLSQTGLKVAPESDLKSLDGATGTEPVVNLSKDRKKSLIDDTPALFEIKNNADAVSEKPNTELASFSEVSANSSHIIAAAKKHKVDADLIRAIIYMETTHGYYDKINVLDNTWLGKKIGAENKSVRPMNINLEYWKDLWEGSLGLSEADIRSPATNIDVGALMLHRIQKRIKDPTVEKIATIYNVLGKENVSDYGARVGAIYREKPWIVSGD